MDAELFVALAHPVTVGLLLASTGANIVYAYHVRSRVMATTHTRAINWPMWRVCRRMLFCLMLITVLIVLFPLPPEPVYAARAVLTRGCLMAMHLSIFWFMGSFERIALQVRRGDRRERGATFIRAMDELAEKERPDDG